MAYENNLPFEDQELCSWLKDTYGLVAERLEVRPGYMSTVVFIQVDSDAYVLKCVRMGDDVRQTFDTQVDLVDFLALKHLLVAKCLNGVDGQRGFEIGPFRLSLWHYLHGQSFCVGNLGALCEAGKTLGSIHDTLKGWETPNCLPALDGNAIIRQVRDVWRRLEGVGQNAQDLVSHLEDSLEDLEIPSSKSSISVVHGDYRAQNLLFQDQQVSGILDWDNMHRGPQIFDVAYALIFFQAVLTPRPLFETEMVAFLEGYTSTANVSPTEWVDLSAWLHLALLKGLTLWAEIYYLDRVSERPKVWIEHYLPLLKDLKKTGRYLKSVVA